MSISLMAGELPPHHRDSFDRMLIAQARMENMALLTADRTFQKIPGADNLLREIRKRTARAGWGGRRGLNPRHSVPQTDALPAELLPPPFDKASLRYFLAMEKRR
jgi:hypothetical protein